MVWHGMAGMAWYGMVWHGMAGMAWYGMVWHGMAKWNGFWKFALFMTPSSSDNFVMCLLAQCISNVEVLVLNFVNHHLY